MPVRSRARPAACERHARAGTSGRARSRGSLPVATLHDDEAAMTVSEEHVSVTKDTVPVEEVSLRKETVRDTETVSEDVAHEELDVDGAVDGDIDGETRDTKNLRR